MPQASIQGLRVSAISLHRSCLWQSHCPVPGPCEGSLIVPDTEKGSQRVQKTGQRGKGAEATGHGNPVNGQGMRISVDLEGKHFAKDLSMTPIPQAPS